MANTDSIAGSSKTRLCSFPDPYAKAKLTDVNSVSHYAPKGVYVSQTSSNKTESPGGVRGVDKENQTTLDSSGTGSFSRFVLDDSLHFISDLIDVGFQCVFPS